MYKYTFDIRLEGEAAIVARSEDEARVELRALLEACLPDTLHSHRVVEFTLSPDDSVYKDGAELTEIDGEDVT